MTRRLILALILVVYLVLGVLFAVNTPSWQAPDEPAHYNYVAYVAQNGSFPVLHPGDYPHGYLEQIKGAGFPPDMPVTAIKYESHQPPMYYLLAAPLYSATGGNLAALRFLSVLLGAGIVLFAYGVGRRAVPGDPRIGLGAAAFVAFLPQHLATVSQVGNDVLAELLLAAVIFVSIGLLSAPVSAGGAKSGAPLRTYLLLGVLLGLILITKTTAYIGVPLALGVVVWRWLQEKPPFRRIVLDVLAAILPAALIALPWYARDIYVYGWPDFLGLGRHEQIVVGQPRTVDFIAQNGWNAYWLRTGEWTFKSFVGVFGWMGVWLDGRVYYLLGLWLAAPVVAWLITRATGPETAVVMGSQSASVTGSQPGMVAITPSGTQTISLSGTETSNLSRAETDSPSANAAFNLSGGPTHENTRSRRPPEDRASARVFALLGVSALLTLLTYVYYNITFLQHQGRYLFTALIPIAVFLALGWRSAFAPRAGRILAVVLVAWSVLLAAWGFLTGHGLPKWPIVITLAVALGIVAAGSLPERFRRWAYAAPYALLPLVALYALFGALVPALTLP